MMQPNQIALVTGAARGIGRAIAQALADAGASVIVNDCDAATLHECAASLNATPCVADVSDSAQVNAMFAALEKQFGWLDVLVNNAAISRPCALSETSDALWRQVLGVNLNGVFHCSRAAFPLLRRRGGSVINLSSVSAYTGRVLSDNAAYVASKAGIDGLTRALAREWAAHGITVNSIAPGIVATEIHAQLTDEQRAGLPALVPSGRLASSREIAAAVCYLASPAARQVTGQTLHINGGMYFA
jgi:3-oxoacyl-[acyl-carrier protein] reductase